jgi:hypothetical protein
MEFESISENKTKVRLTNLGYKQGENWEESLKFFDTAWGNVLENLRKSFEEPGWKFQGQQ